MVRVEVRTLGKVRSSISRPLLRVALSCQAIDLSRLTPGSPRSHLDLISSQVGIGEVGSLLSLTWSLT